MSDRGGLERACKKKKKLTSKPIRKATAGGPTYFPSGTGILESGLASSATGESSSVTSLGDKGGAEEIVTRVIRSVLSDSDLSESSVILSGLSDTCSTGGTCPTGAGSTSSGDLVSS